MAYTAAGCLLGDRIMVRNKFLNKKIIFLFIVIFLFSVSVFILKRYTAKIPKKKEDVFLTIVKTKKIKENVNSDFSEKQQEIINQCSTTAAKTITKDKEIINDKEIEILIEQLGSKNWEDVQEAVDKLIDLERQAVPELIKEMQDASESIKGQIIFILGEIQDKRATSALIDLFKEKNAYIRQNVAEALGKIKDGRTLSVLIDGLSDKSTKVRRSSAWALGELRDPQAVDDLLNQLTYEKEEGAKIAMINALGKIKDQRATLELLEELKSKNDQIYKNEIVTALGEIKDSRALPELVDYVNELKRYRPTEKMFIFQLRHAIEIAKEAMQKIERNN